MKAVRFDHYGGVDVLNVVDVADPVPVEGEVLVRVKAAGINPGEAAIRKGALHDRFPATFPSGEGSDFAGVIEQIGRAVDHWRPGDEVIGFTNKRASHAELVVVPADQLTSRPTSVPWDVGGALFVAGVTAWAAVRAVRPSSGDTVVVSGAAGGVGTIAVQLARIAGATVIGLASEPHHEWLLLHGAIPLTYGEGVKDRIRTVADGRVNAFVDAHGGGYVDLAIDLGVPRDRIDTIADFGAARRYGTKTDGSAVGSSATVLGELVDRIEERELEIPIAHAYPLAEVRAAYRELSRGHTLGKIVLRP